VLYAGHTARIEMGLFNIIIRVRWQTSLCCLSRWHFSPTHTHTHTHTHKHWASLIACSFNIPVAILLATSLQGVPKTSSSAIVVHQQFRWQSDFIFLGIFTLNAIKHVQNNLFFASKHLSIFL